MKTVMSTKLLFPMLFSSFKKTSGSLFDTGGPISPKVFCHKNFGDIGHFRWYTHFRRYGDRNNVKKRKTHGVRNDAMCQIFFQFSKVFYN